MDKDFELHCNVFHSLKVGFCKGQQGDAKRRAEQHIKRIFSCTFTNDLVSQPCKLFGNFLDF